MKTVLTIFLTWSFSMLIIAILIVFGSDLRDMANQFLAAHGHQRRVDVQLHGCANINGILYCINTAESTVTK